MYPTSLTIQMIYDTMQCVLAHIAADFWESDLDFSKLDTIFQSQGETCQPHSILHGNLMSTLDHSMWSHQVHANAPNLGNVAKGSQSLLVPTESHACHSMELEVS